ncbi:MAG: hypothetical protein NT076_04035 [Candidatus Pacearchaeota archaeon]|nr:hypothetical protein [Candidatus Pacearchaeota archaeon]
MATTERSAGLLPADEWTAIDPDERQDFKDLADAQKQYGGVNGTAKTALRIYIEKDLVPRIVRDYDFFGFAPPSKFGVYFRDSNDPIHTEVILEASERGLKKIIEPSIRLAFDQGDVLKARLFLKKSYLPQAVIHLMTAHQTLGNEAYKFKPTVERTESGLVITPITAGPQALADILRFEELIEKANLQPHIRPHIRIGTNDDFSPEILKRARELDGLDLLRILGIGR